MSILVLCPTRDNPEGASRAFQTMLDNSSDAHMAMCIDVDQEGLYLDLEHPRMLKSVAPRTDIVGSINAAADRFPGYDIYGMMTDDAVFNTSGWDVWTQGVFDSFPKRLGVVSPFHNGGAFVNFPYVSREWIDLVGWFACPETQHFCWDTVLEMLGEATAIRYATRDEFRLHHFVDRNDKTVPVFMMDCVQFLGWCVNRRRDLVLKIREAQAL